MLLAIDSGNTNIVFGVFDKGGKLLGKWRHNTHPICSADELGIFLTSLLELNNINQLDITSTIISTVVPANLRNLKQLCENYFNSKPFIIGDSNVKTNIKHLIDNPQELGADRIVNCVAAKERYGSNLIIVDFGTATTFDVTNTDGDFIGGAIAPGVNLAVEALYRAAAKAPLVEVKAPLKVVGTNTVTSIESGIYWGYIGLVEGIIKRIQDETGVDYKIIATGGLAPLFIKDCPVLQKLDSDLTLFGLYKIFEMNR